MDSSLPLWRKVSPWRHEHRTSPISRAYRTIAITSSGQLHITRRAEPFPEQAELLLYFFERTRLRAVRVLAQVTTRAGEIALRHRADGRAAASVVTTQKLRRAAQPFRETRPCSAVEDASQLSLRGSQCRPPAARGRANYPLAKLAVCENSPAVIPRHP